MSKINFKFNFRRMYLSFDDTKKETTLETILDDFIKHKMNKREEIKKDEKEIVLCKSEKFDNGDISLVYELINFGEKRKIKNRDTLNIDGSMNENQYIEKYQYIYFHKKDENNYNVAFHYNRQGITYKKFLKIFDDFYNEFKKDNEEDLSNVLLLSSTYYSKNFFEKISELNTVSSLELEGVFENPDLEFAGIENSPKFRCETKSIIKVKPIGKRFAYFSSEEILEFIKEKENQFGHLKIKLHGRDIYNESQNLVSDNLELLHIIKTDIYEDKILEYNSVILKLKDDISKVLNDGWIEISEN